jgi:ribonuclease HII
MDAMHEQYPEYGWDTNAGYPTVKHREGIKAHGPTKIHRMTFRLLP